MALRGVRLSNGAAGVCGSRMALRGVRLPNGAALGSFSGSFWLSLLPTLPTGGRCPRRAPVKCPLTAAHLTGASRYCPRCPREGGAHAVPR